MNLEQTEREKYEKIWTHKDYRANSPGEGLVPHFLKHVPFKEGDSLIDLGCGTGRAGVELWRAKLDVTLFDIAKDALDPGAKSLPFVQGCLWEGIPLKESNHGIFRYDWFYCCDVMEHIPPEKVDRVLDNCAAIATKGGFFQIALFPSEWHGEVLHLTVEKAGWWVEKLKARWAQVDITTPESGHVVAIVGK